MYSFSRWKCDTSYPTFSASRSAISFRNNCLHVSPLTCSAKIITENYRIGRWSTI